MKRFFSVTLCFVCIFLMSSCKKEDRFDLTELKLRLEEADEKYSFSYEDIFYSDSVFYIYYSFCEENDVLLTVKEDKDLRLVRISSAVWNTADENTLNEYRKFCETLTDIFVSAKESAGFIDETRLFEDGVMFTDFLSVTEKTNYTARAFSSEFGAVYVLEFNIH